MSSSPSNRITIYSSTLHPMLSELQLVEEELVVRTQNVKLALSQEQQMSKGKGKRERIRSDLIRSRRLDRVEEDYRRNEVDQDH